MERKEIIDTLFMLYSRRIKCLIGHENDAFIRGLLELMFQRFDEIDNVPGYGMYAQNMHKILESTLNFNADGVSAQLSIRELTDRLEDYIKQNIAVIWPEMRFDYKADDINSTEKNDYRKFINRKFRELTQDQENHYQLPTTLSKSNSRKIYRQLYHVIEVRNRRTHIKGSGASILYKRCHFLEASETVLAYILYTFYHKCFIMNYLPNEPTKNEPYIIRTTRV